MERALLHANLRKANTSENKQLRKDLRVPAVLYGSHIDPKPISLGHTELIKFIRDHHVGSSLNLELEGEEYFVILKDVQTHPVRGHILHLDFQALQAGEKVRVTIPVFLHGLDKIHDDLIVQELNTEIELSVLPQFLIDSIIVDVSEVKVGDSLSIADLPINSDENFEVFSNPDQMIYTVMEATVFEEADEEDESSLFDVEDATKEVDEDGKED
ncbi:MAG: 50S ribosomal protein L25 [Tissierellia bacterium]|nr:50S ribosomal protein L25 [Tissierellia bacterium]